MGNPPKIDKRILRFWILVHCRECLGISYLSGSNPYMVWLFVQPEGFWVRYSIQVWAAVAVSHAKPLVNHHPGTPMLIALQRFWLKPLPLVWPISTSWPATTRIGRDSDCVCVLTANKWTKMVLQLGKSMLQRGFEWVSSSKLMTIIQMDSKRHIA